jgi:hypothetical protein
LADAPKRVKRLYGGFAFRSGEHLFEYEDAYQKLCFTAWNRFAGPEHDDSARRWEEEFFKQVNEIVMEKKRLKISKLENPA